MEKMHKYRLNEMASQQDDEQRHTRPLYDEASSSVSLPPFLPPFDAAHDPIIRSQRLRASQLGLIDQSATLPRDEEQDRFPNAQADVEATTIASPSVDRTENVHDAGSRAYSGTSSTTERRRYWQRRLKENMRQLKKKMNVRDFLTWLQVFALIALIVLLLTTSNTVGSMNMKLLSERNEDQLHKALASITNMAQGISNFTGDNATQADIKQGLHSAANIVESIGSVAEDITDFASDDATQADIKQGLHSAAIFVESIGSVAEDVNHFTRKQTTQEDFDDVLQKLGKLIHKGLDQFD